MKTFTLKPKVRNFFLFSLLLMIATVSCRKSDVTYNPVPPGPTNKEVNVFTNQPLRMVSDFEHSNSLPFQANLCYQVGSAMVGEGGTIGTIGEIIKTLKEVHDYKKPDTAYDNLKNGINSLQSQITALTSQITALGQQLSLDVSQLTGYMGTLYTNTYIGYLRDALDSTASDGLTYFPKTAALYKTQGLSPTNPLVLSLQTDAVSYANLVHPTPGAPSIQYDMKNIVTQLNLLIVPAGTPNNNVVMNYTNEIINACQGKGYNDAASVHNLYMLLECYFLSLVNYQFQATNIYSNACSLVDSTGTDARDWYTETFTTMIEQEVAVYLHAVNYLMVNVNDYRTQNQFLSDLKYADAGLSENMVVLPAMARAQFVANMLYTALGKPCPVIAGSIITPNKYSNGSNSYINTISLTAVAPGVAGKPYNATADNNFGINGIPSQIPNTTWVSGSPTVCNPDNHWNVYNFGTLGVPDSNWHLLPGQTMGVQINDNGNQNPWPHNIQIQGQVNLLWYNPADPSQTSTSQTSTCTMQYGYFCGSWGWGFPYVSHSDLSLMARTPTFNIDHFNNTLQGGNIWDAQPPFMATTDEGGNIYIHSPDGFTFDYNSLAGMYYNAAGVQTSHYYILADLWYTNITTGSEKPSINGTLQGWGAFNASYSMGGTNSDLWIIMGTGLSRFNAGGGGSTVDWSYYAGSDIMESFAQNRQGPAYSQIGCSVDMKTSQAYQPCISYYYQTYNVGSAPASISIRPMYTFVYGGTYPVPTPY
jgi:hypothetical protein